MKTTLITLASALLITLTLSAQNPAGKQDPVYQIVEEMPEFPGGQKALMDYLGKCPYPAAAIEDSIGGSVYVRFIVEKNGEVSHVEISKGADNILNEAALEHVRNMPAWKPGYQNGDPVRVQYIVPFNFHFPDDNKPQKKKGKG